MKWSYCLVNEPGDLQKSGLSSRVVRKIVVLEVKWSYCLVNKPGDLQNSGLSSQAVRKIVVLIVSWLLDVFLLSCFTFFVYMLFSIFFLSIQVSSCIQW